MTYIMGLGIAFLAAFANYWTTWIFALFFTSTYTSYHVYKKIHWSVGLVTLSTFTSTLFIMLNWNTRYWQLDQSTVMSFQHVSLLSFISFAVLIHVGLSLDEKKLKLATKAIVIMSLIDSVIACAVALGLPTNPFANLSMNGCFMVMALPFIYKSWDKRLMLPILLGIFATQSSIPIIGSNIVLTILFARNITDYVGSLVLPACAIMLFSNFANTTGRFVLWKESLKWFWQNGDIYLGMGNGTFFMWGPHIQQVTKINVGNWFVWAHNDFVQTLFEQGIVGFGLLSIMIFYAIKFSLNRKYLLAALAGYLFMAFFNFIVHLPVHAAIGVLLIFSIFHGRENQNEQKTSRKVFK